MKEKLQSSRDQLRATHYREEKNQLVSAGLSETLISCNLTQHRLFSVERFICDCNHKGWFVRRQLPVVLYPDHALRELIQGGARTIYYYLLSDTVEDQDMLFN